VSGLIDGTYSAAVEAGLADAGEVRHHPRRIVRLTPAAGEASAALKEFLRRHVYSAEVLLEERKRVTAMLAELFGFFLEHPDRLPHPYSEQAAGEAAHRVVCDYIAGMTDGFFRRTYQRIVEDGG
jgi:dGTPase